MIKYYRKLDDKMLQLTPRRAHLLETNCCTRACLPASHWCHFEPGLWRREQDSMKVTEVVGGMEGLGKPEGKGSKRSVPLRNKRGPP